MAQKAIHFVGTINPEYGDGWAYCGRLVKEADAYDENEPGRDEITCRQCRAAIRKQDRQVA